MTDKSAFDRQEVESFFGSHPLCFLCRKKRADDLDHIWGRAKKQEIYSSLLNCAPICREPCHTRKKTFDNKKALSHRVQSHLNAMQFIPKEKDLLFIEKHSRYYN